MEILDGKKVSAKVRKNLKLEVDNLKKEGIKPKLAVIMVGDDIASKVYVRNKNKACEEIGIEYEEFLLNTDTTMEELLNVIDNLNKNQNIDGILLQSPIPKHLDINKAFSAILPEKDVDGFHPINAGKLSIGEKCFVPCTPHGVVKIMEEYNIETENIIHHVIELFKAINEEELALQYAQIEKQQNDFGKKKPTKVIKVGRNDPCPCGSGKKYKKCCGK